MFFHGIRMDERNRLRWWIFAIFVSRPIQNKEYNANVENFKTVWTYQTSQEKALKFMNIIGPSSKNLVFKKRCDWIIFFQEPLFE